MNWSWLQVETVREKRRREVEFSKAGLELPHAEKCFTKRKRHNASQSTDLEVYEDKSSLPAIDVHSFTNMQSSHDELVSSDGQGGVSVEEVADDSTQPSLPEFVDKSTHSSQIEETIIKPTVSNYFIMHIYLSSHNNFHLGSVFQVFSNAYLEQDAMDSDPNYNSDGENDQSNYTSTSNLVAPPVVHVSRPKDVEKQRMGLPIVMMEQEIMEAINRKICVIICGETGCGKTTQVPQVR